MALFTSEPDKSTTTGPIVKPSPVEPAKAAVPAPAAERTAAGAARLDRGTKISGQLRFDGPAQIDGHVDGEIDGKEITIGESAVVSAQMRAESVVVCGEYKGEITASQRIEIRNTAKLTGNISAPKLIVQEGAVFEGKCSMTSQPAQRDHAPATQRNGAPAANATQA
jgi:cytoskeletal protein CcmA (bactofilin family)